MFRFTIRDVLWSMVVVGLAIGWWIDHAKARHFREVVTHLLSWHDISISRRQGDIWITRNSANESWAESEVPLYERRPWIR